MGRHTLTRTAFILGMLAAPGTGRAFKCDVDVWPLTLSSLVEEGDVPEVETSRWPTQAELSNPNVGSFRFDGHDNDLRFDLQREEEP